MSLVLFFDHSVGNRLFMKLLDDEFTELKQFVTTSANFVKNPWLLELSEQKDVPIVIIEETKGIQSIEKADQAFLASWKYKLDDDLLNHFNDNVFNLHYSLLPKFPGSYPVNQALLSGELTSGFTIHKATSQLDSGPILLQKSLQIYTWENTEDFMKRLDDLVIENYKLIIQSIQKGLQENLGNTSFLHPLVTKQEINDRRRIDITLPMSALEFLNNVRAMTVPGIHAYPTFIDPVSGTEIEIQLKLNRRRQS